MLLVALGGLALFLLGINRITVALQATAGPATRRWMAAATNSPFRALLTGAAVSAATQSGTAPAVTALGLVAGGLITTSAGLALSLGAKVGGTLAIQLAAFSIGQYALPMIGIGYLLTLWKRGQAIGGLVLGAGLLFLGLDTAVTAIASLSESELFRLLLDAAEAQPIAMVVFGFILGTVMASANAAAAVALGLFVAGMISMPTALALLVGGNAGSTMLPLIVSRSLDPAATRVALIHLLLKAAAALVAVVFAGPVSAGVIALGGDGARQVANAHTLFNLVVALLATLFAAPLMALGKRLVPVGEDDAAPKYLRQEAIGDPALGIALAQREMVRISDHVAFMTELAVSYVRAGKWDVMRLESREAKVDKLTLQVVDYLALLRRAGGGEDADSERLLLITTELEHIGDQMRRLQRREEKLREAGFEFSKQGRAELGDTGQLVLDRMRVAFTALATGDKEMARQVTAARPEMERHVASMRISHLGRLEARLPQSRASSSHHLEILTLFRQVDASVTRIAGWVLET